ncbi:MAG: regulatory protein RecX [Mariprofundaceae bacterium]|nr:regulatory protein RecX [Mariprofundaceae bacterium]
MARQDVQAVYSIALRMLTQREHCEVELRNKLLQRHCDEIAVDSAIEQLKSYNYLSESRFAEAFLQSRIKKGEAPWLAAEKARQKGVDESALQGVLEDIVAEYDGLQACQHVLAKRDPQQQWRYNQRAWQRQARYLRSKGFDAATILEALNLENED